MSTTVRKLVIATGLALSTFAAQADVQSTFDVALSVQWVGGIVNGQETPHFTTGSGFGGITDGGKVIQWGHGYKENVNTYLTNDKNYPLSALVLSNTPAGVSLDTNGASANVNIFQHYNREIPSSVKSLTNATFRVTASIQTEFGVNVTTVTHDFNVYFMETPNTGGTCAWGACDNDVFAVVSGLGFSDTFNFGGENYTLNYFDNSKVFGQLSNGACNAVGIAGNTPCYGFTTAENSVTSAQFALSVSGPQVPQIPEPETYAMLLAGLGVIGTVARRRRNIR